MHLPPHAEVCVVGTQGFIKPLADISTFKETKAALSCLWVGGWPSEEGQGAGSPPGV